MKLLVKTNLYFLFLSIPILILSGVIGYYFITAELKESNNDMLLERKIMIEQYLRDNDSISLGLITRSKEAEIKKISNLDLKQENRTLFLDTLIYDKTEKELAINQMIVSNVKVNNTNYQIKIWRSTLEFEELFEGIFILLTSILLLQIIVSMFINFWVSRTLWKPFYNALHSLKVFRTSNNEVPEFEKTTIKEFKKLNHSLKEMMNKMLLDYNSQKKFTENASHEIQTPLAVIKSKVDLLIQSENLQPDEIELIIAIDDACSKLIRLNKSLLLLTKIENRQFKTTETVSAQKMVNDSLVLFEEHIKERKIAVQMTIQSDFLIHINPDLCLILINNLFQNAIRHNIHKGRITIVIKKNSLCIQNTGQSEPLDMILLVKRFQKASTSPLSTGLGLAIANEIAEVSGLKLKYEFAAEEHHFTLKLK